MRICVDGTPLLTNSAGVKTYLFHWIKGLRASECQNSLRIFPWIGDFGKLRHEQSITGTMGTWLRLALLGEINRRKSLQWIPKVLDGRADVFHISNLLHHPPQRQLITATIHDLTTWIMPEVHTPANVAADRLFAQRVLKSARRCIAVSHNSKKDAIEILGLSPDRIDVIHHGVAETYLQVTDEVAAGIAQKYQLQRPYILFHGTIEPRKNIDLLLDAYLALAPELREEVDLVLTGMMGWAAPATVARLTQTSTHIRYLGYVPEEDMPGLTRGAALFVYPTLYEGFGFPVLQAMACGVPAVTSNIASLPEITGDAAVLIDPRSVAELQNAMETVLLSPTLRSRLSTQGRARAVSFRWSDAAEKTWAFFQRAHGG